MKPKLLVVEDDEAIRTQMKWALAQDYEVLLAEDRLRALEILKNEQPSVVVLDLGLPPDPGGVEEGLPYGYIHSGRGDGAVIVPLSKADGVYVSEVPVPKADSIVQ